MSITERGICLTFLFIDCRYKNTQDRHQNMARQPGGYPDSYVNIYNNKYSVSQKHIFYSDHFKIFMTSIMFCHDEIYIRLH